jgi:hypothetical protein
MSQQDTSGRFPELKPNSSSAGAGVSTSVGTPTLSWVA